MLLQHNEKLDLRSYTGCLPPHYLHLLESSGNLPIRPSNALRNVADVLRGNVGNIAASKHPGTIVRFFFEILSSCAEDLVPSSQYELKP